MFPLFAVLLDFILKHKNIIFNPLLEYSNSILRVPDTGSKVFFNLIFPRFRRWPFYCSEHAVKIIFIARGNRQNIRNIMINKLCR